MVTTSLFSSGRLQIKIVFSAQIETISFSSAKKIGLVYCKNDELNLEDGFVLKI